MFSYFANPRKFLTLTNKIQFPLLFITFLSFVLGLYYALFDSPPDYQQGESVRMMYIHVPAAWLCTLIFVFMAFMSGIAFIWKHTLADILAQEAASIGALYTLIALFTGSLWGKVSWGTFWVWDARLTSVLLLLFLYIGYLSLKANLTSPQSTKLLRLMALIGLLNIPIIKGSVQWWTTLHQPSSIFRPQGISIHASMLLPLFCMALAFGLLFLTVLILKTQTRLRDAKRLSILRKEHS